MRRLTLASHSSVGSSPIACSSQTRYSKVAMDVVDRLLMYVGLSPTIGIGLREDHDRLAMVRLVQHEFISLVAADIQCECLRGNMRFCCSPVQPIPDVRFVATESGHDVSMTVHRAAVDGILTFRDTDVLTFTPDQDLQDNTTYEVWLPAGGIKDVAGNGIDGFRFVLSTGATIDDFAGTGGGLRNQEMIEKVLAGDRSSDYESSPRVSMRGLFIPPFIPRREEELLSSVFATHIGDQDIPGDLGHIILHGWESSLSNMKIARFCFQFDRCKCPEFVQLRSKRIYVENHLPERLRADHRKN